MPIRGWYVLAPVLLAAVMWTLGCQSQTETAGNGQSADEHSHDEHGDHDHDHAHEHSHATGPNEGHLVELGGDYLAEWVHDDENDTVTVILFNHPEGEEKPQETAIDAQEVTIESVHGEAKKTYKLRAVDPEKPSRFTLKDWEVLSAVTNGELNNTLIVETGGKTYRKKLEHHDH